MSIKTVSSCLLGESLTIGYAFREERGKLTTYKLMCDGTIVERTYNTSGLLNFLKLSFAKRSMPKESKDSMQQHYNFHCIVNDYFRATAVTRKHISERNDLKEFQKSPLRDYAIGNHYPHGHGFAMG